MDKTSHRILLITTSIAFITLILFISCSKKNTIEKIPVDPAKEGKQEVIWFDTDFPPITIQSGNFAHQGYADYLKEKLISELDEYNNVIVEGNLKRLLSDIKEKDNIVNLTLLRTREREQYIEFSDPWIIHFNNFLYIKKTDKEKIQPHLTDEGKVRLDKLLSSGQFVLGVEVARSYSPIIDTAIEKFADTPLIEERTLRNKDISLLSTLLHEDRGINGIILYPEELMFLCRDNGLDETQLMSYPIEGQPEYILGYIGASKSKLGKEIIGKINSILSKELIKENLKHYADWIDKDLHESLYELLNEVYK